MGRIHFGERKTYEDGLLEAMLLVQSFVPELDDIPGLNKANKDDMEKALNAIMNICDDVINFVFQRKTDALARIIREYSSSSIVLRRTIEKTHNVAKIHS